VRSYLKNKLKAKWLRGMAQVVECWSSKPEDLGSICRVKNNNNNNNNKALVVDFFLSKFHHVLGRNRIKMDLPSVVWLIEEGRKLNV
jgi:hypothetical protein